MNDKFNKRKKKKRNFQKSANRNENAGTRKFFDDFKNYEGESETNDPSWYAQYPELMADSASIPYSIPTGTEISWDVVTESGYPIISNGTDNVYESVPGIMTLGILPTPGVSKDATSPVNVAADMLYTKVRAENSGARNYDSPDLMLYCLAMDQVYSLLTWYNRIYGIIMLYSQVNRYLPKALLEAQWIDAGDMLLHINDYKAFIDTATAQAAVFSIPNDMKLFNRHAFMYQNIYKDAESAKSQMYMFAPRGFYAYDEVSGAGKLKAVNVVSVYPNKMKFTDLVHLFHTLMDPIIASEDFNIMSGDILKAFGEGNLLKLQIMPQGYTIMPITDYEVLTQIKNATLSNLSTFANLGFGSNTDWDIHQDANADYIEWNPAITTNTAGPRASYVKDRYLSTYKSQPTPADNMVATRLMYAVEEVDESTSSTTAYVTRFDAVGSEFVIAATVTLFMHDANGVWNTKEYAIHTFSENASGFPQANILRTMLLIKHFDFCPALYILQKTGSNTTLYYPVFDLDNWTIVHAYELEKMHRTALMSMLRVPMIGSALPSNLRAN